LVLSLHSLYFWYGIGETKNEVFQASGYCWSSVVYRCWYGIRGEHDSYTSHQIVVIKPVGHPTGLSLSDGRFDHVEPFLLTPPIVDYASKYYYSVITKYIWISVDNLVKYYRRQMGLHSH
jgi:hypothetical protein